MSNDNLLLKWGSLKGWDIDEKNIDAIDLLKEWHRLGVCYSAAMQHDTPEQKNILCNLIRVHTGTITNDWSGEYYTKEQAIDYVMNYGINTGRKI